MNESTWNAVLRGAAKQGVALGLGAVMGAVTRTLPNLKERARHPQIPLTTIQMGQAMAVAAIGGAGVKGTVAAGAAIVVAKAAAATAVATAAAPVVVTATVVGATVYGVSKLLK